MPQNNGGTVTKLSDYRSTTQDQKIDPSNLKSGGGGDRFDPMESRVTALEKRFDRFEAKLDAIVKDLAEVKGRVSTMPSTWQLLGMILAIMGASFAIIRFGLVH